MTSLTSGNIKIALHAIRTSKMRSFLTVLGIIISVSSVIVAVSLGEGVRHQVAGHVKQVGSDVITIRPGKLVDRDASGTITKVNYSSALVVNTLTDQDAAALKQVEGVDTIVPLAFVSGAASESGGRSFTTGTIVGTAADFPDVIQQKVQYGEFFSSGETNRAVAVIGKGVAEKLYQENIPIGKIITLRGREFIIQGVFDTFDSNALSDTTNLNDAIFIPYNAAKSLSGNNVHVAQILVRPSNPAKTNDVIKSITRRLTDAHGGQEDFTALKQSELLTVTGNALTIATAFVTSIAAISLLVGGIGVMNIMFVSVTERTREIGIRKSLGATNRQIYNQFLMEASILSLSGGFLGVVISLAAVYFIRIFTDIQPVLTLPVMVLAVSVSLLVGIVFGTAPAVKAARKDPIQALRYE